MKILREEVLHIAELSRLSFSENELEAMGSHLDGLLEQLEKLDSVDTSIVAPTAHILEAVNVLREDEVSPSFDRELLLKNAPETSDGCYVVPRVVE